MRLLTVSSAKWGIQNTVYNLIQKSVDANTNHTHLTLPIHSTPDEAERIELLSKPLLRLLDSIRPLYLLYAIHLFWFQAYRHLTGYADQYDVIWLHSPMLLPLLPNQIAHKTVITIHGPLTPTRSDQHNFPANLYYQLLGRIQRAGIDNNTDVTYTAVHEEIATDLEGLGVSSNRIHVIGNGVNVKRFSPDTFSDRFADLASSPGITLLSVGRLIDLKRPLALLKTFAQAQQRTTRDLQLVIVGDGPLRKRAERFVAERGLADSVMFLGVIEYEAMPKIYAAADFFTLASEYEGEPLVLYEAMASGLPSIVSNIPSCESVGNKDCGIITNFAEPADAAADLVEYLHMDHTTHSKNAREYAEQHLTWAARAEEYQAIFKQIVAQSK